VFVVICKKITWVGWNPQSMGGGFHKCMMELVVRLGQIKIGFHAISWHILITSYTATLFFKIFDIIFSVITATHNFI
jgi:hypothetical protein